MTEEIYFRGVHNVTEFTRNELFVSFRQGGYQLSEASFYKKVEDMVNDGEIVRDVIIIVCRMISGRCTVMTIRNWRKKWHCN